MRLDGKVHAAACLAIAACGIPTSPRITVQRWILPVNETALEVAEPLPAGVSIVGNAFDVTVDPVSTGA